MTTILETLAPVNPASSEPTTAEMMARSALTLHGVNAYLAGYWAKARREDAAAARGVSCPPWDADGETDDALAYDGYPTEDDRAYAATCWADSEGLTDDEDARFNIRTLTVSALDRLLDERAEESEAADRVCYAGCC